MNENIEKLKEELKECTLMKSDHLTTGMKYCV